jgi:excisionase family DNA binding protein
MEQKTIPRRRLWRTREVANYTGLGKSTLDKLRLSGGGCPYIRVGRVVLYDPDDVDAWLTTCRHSRHEHPRPEQTSGIQPHKEEASDESAS